ncbi:mutator type transposase [Tanacetum coccineum]
MIKEMITRVAVEQRRELHLKKNDKKRLRCICKRKVPQFSCEDGDDVSGSKGVGSDGSKSKSQSKEKGQVSGSKGKSINKTKAGGGLKIRMPLGVIPAIAEIFPSAEDRFCLKYIYDNMKLSWRGRAHCDVLLNNMCEVLNRELVDGRDKPIITCLEFIKEYLMKRIVNEQKVISKSDGPHTPNATKVFKKIMKDAGQIKCVVNMRTKECSCRKWELIGIPCKHAIAAIWNMPSNGKKLAYHNLTVINPIGYQHGKICIGLK